MLGTWQEGNPGLPQAPALMRELFQSHARIFAVYRSKETTNVSCGTQLLTLCSVGTVPCFAISNNRVLSDELLHFAQSPIIPSIKIRAQTCVSLTRPLLSEDAGHLSQPPVPQEGPREVLHLCFL